MISGCSQTCETSCASKPASCKQATGSPAKCRLAANITCATGDSTIQLLNGTDFDLKGFDITCTATSPNNCNYVAITMGAAASKVTNSATSPAFESVTSGRFNTGIDCAGTSTSVVENVTVADSIVAISNCQTVRNNVVRPTSQSFSGTNWGILTSGVSNADSITDNYVQGRVEPIESTSSLSIDILRNVIKGTGLIAIEIGSGQSSSSGNIKNNIIFAPDGIPGVFSGTVIAVGGTSSVNFDGNFCDPDIVDCSSCISSGWCEPYTSPFSGN